MTFYGSQSETPVYSMSDLVADLVAVSRGACAVGRETRNVAWALLVRLGDEGVEEAQVALRKLNTARKRRPNPRRATATIGDIFHTSKKENRT
jgi:hypothetical protein